MAFLAKSVLAVIHTCKRDDQTGHQTTPLHSQKIRSVTMQTWLLSLVFNKTSGIVWASCVSPSHAAKPLPLPGMPNRHATSYCTENNQHSCTMLHWCRCKAL